MGNHRTKYIIVDTNIVQYSGSKPTERSYQITNLILDREKEGFTKAISLVTCYESVQNRNSIQEQKILQNLNLYTQLDTDRKVYLFAGWLSDFYKRDSIPETQINTCDQLIAATSILTTSEILTANRRDFPSPFFNEVKTFNISFTSKNQEQFVKVYILEPDFVVINKFIRERKKSK